MEKIDWKKVTKEDRNIFQSVRFANFFGDTAFSMLYAWQKRFYYQYHCFGEWIVVNGIGVNEKTGWILISDNPKADCYPIIKELWHYQKKRKEDLTFEYVSEQQLSGYQEAINRLGLQCSITSMDQYSDYLYETQEFLSLDGKQNKTKRGNENWLLKHYPGLRYESYTREKRDDCIHVFDAWCEAHSCGNCYYGCEKQALLRFLDIYDESCHKIGLSYFEDEPLSFAVAEQINDNTISYYFQKNARSIRGLTYWLNRQMALEHLDIPYINLGEDMGMEGLRMDKTCLHPCCKLKKYSISII